MNAWVRFGHHRTPLLGLALFAVITIITAVTIRVRLDAGHTHVAPGQPVGRGIGPAEEAVASWTSAIQQRDLTGAVAYMDQSDPMVITHWRDRLNQQVQHRFLDPTQAPAVPHIEQTGTSWHAVVRWPPTERPGQVTSGRSICLQVQISAEAKILPIGQFFYWCNEHGL